MALIPRRFGKRLRQLLEEFPVVCILGPRQCGKTTFVKSVLPHWRYVDLEKPSDLAKVEDDPEGALKLWGEKILFDEAQQLPPLFSILRSTVDQNRKAHGRFVLLGSASPSLVQNISESLAGRVGFLDMSPFLLEEVSDPESLWFRGGFPDAYLEKNDLRRRDWFESYTRTFIERDLTRLGIEVSAAQMRKLWGMLAHVHAGLWNASELGASLGTSYHTVNRYVDILEQAFLVRRLMPYSVNIGKRLVKTPKIYLRDTGLLHYFLGISSQDELSAHPKRGWSWEGFVIEQVIMFFSLHNLGFEFFFWKATKNQEVDLLLKKGSKIVPLEIKLHTAPGKSNLKGIAACMNDLRLKEGYVIRPSGESYSLGDGIRVVTLKQFFSVCLNA